MKITSPSFDLLHSIFFITVSSHDCNFITCLPFLLPVLYLLVHLLNHPVKRLSACWTPRNYPFLMTGYLHLFHIPCSFSSHHLGDPPSCYNCMKLWRTFWWLFCTDFCRLTGHWQQSAWLFHDWICHMQTVVSLFHLQTMVKPVFLSHQPVS